MGAGMLGVFRSTEPWGSCDCMTAAVVQVTGVLCVCVCVCACV